MSKKRRSGGDDINMDVMMDSVTNVVGTLLLILIVVQLQISSTVETIQTVLKNITAKDVAMLKQKVQQQDKELKKVDPVVLDKEYQQAEGKVEETQKAVKAYSNEGQEKGFKLLPVQQLIEMRKEIETQVDADKKIFQELASERTKLQAALDKTPVRPPAPAAEMTIPAARPVPKGAVFVDVLCARNRLYFLSDDTYKTMAEKAWDAVKGSMVKSNSVDEKTKKVTVFYDHQKAHDWFNKWATNIADTNLAVTFPMRKNEDRVRMEVLPKPDGGFSIEDLKKSDNGFRKLVAQLRRDPKFVLFFRINPDSVEAYIEGREIAMNMGMPAGWEFYRWGSIGLHLNFLVNRLEPYKPYVPPTTERQKSSTIVIAAPKRTVD